VGLDKLGVAGVARDRVEALVRAIDFSDVLMQGMLSVLLFAGALHIDLGRLRHYRWQIGALALVGTVASTAVVGVAAWLVLPWIGVSLPLVYCLLFGALISPTDPIAVMSVLKSAGAPRDLELVIAGESLFNDGIGVVVFALLVAAASRGMPSWEAAGLLLLQAAVGGIVFGLVLGWVTCRLLSRVDEYNVEVLLTLAAVIGGSSLASRLHVSGPLAMVVAGLLVGNQGRAHAMSETTRRYIDMFWQLLDEILNAVLFVLIGFEVLLVAFSAKLLLAGALAIAITLVARWLVVGVPVALLAPWFRLPRGAARVLTWGGLRGGISVALALSIPAAGARDTLLTLTYCVVVFSILVQGLSIGRVVKRALAGEPADAARPSS
jgi:CPA1 family monovalent cation:H+ antiporter